MCIQYTVETNGIHSLVAKTTMFVEITKQGLACGPKINQIFFLPCEYGYLYPPSAVTTDVIDHGLFNVFWRLFQYSVSHVKNNLKNWKSGLSYSLTRTKKCWDYSRFPAKRLFQFWWHIFVNCILWQLFRCAHFFHLSLIPVILSFETYNEIAGSLHVEHAVEKLCRR